jgi:hypothetical protein
LPERFGLDSALHVKKHPATRFPFRHVERGRNHPFYPKSVGQLTPASVPRHSRRGAPRLRPCGSGAPVSPGGQHQRHSR